MSVPPTTTRPVLVVSSPPTTLRSVDLPDPLGPMTATSSPGRTVSDTSSRATTDPSPCPWIRVTCSSSNAVMNSSLVGQYRFAVIEPADLGLDLKHQRLQREGGREIGGRPLLRFLPRELLQVVHRGTTLLLYDVVDVGAGAHGHGELDRQVIA